MSIKFYPLVASQEVDAAGEQCPPIPHGEGHDTAEEAHLEGISLGEEHTYTHKISEVWE